MRSKLIALVVAAPAILAAQQPAAMPDTAFHQISLADALSLARDNNVSNITASNAIRSANNTVRSARAQYLPTLNASAGQSIQQGSKLGERNSLITKCPSKYKTAPAGENQNA